MFNLPEISETVSASFNILKEIEFDRRARERDLLPATYGKTFEEFYGVDPLPKVKDLEIHYAPEENPKSEEVQKTPCSSACTRTLSRKCIRHVPKVPSFRDQQYSNISMIVETPKSIRRAEARKAPVNPQPTEKARLKARHDYYGTCLDSPWNGLCPECQDKLLRRNWQQRNTREW